jgi:tRNA(His) 5'-end guanylyltransferase
VLAGAWTVLRLDGRGCSRFTQQRIAFVDHMVATTQVLLVELGARYAYTESDEIFPAA